VSRRTPTWLEKHAVLAVHQMLLAEFGGGLWGATPSA
jgi:hypothetical protein